MKTKTNLKKIAVITMAHNDEFFLTRWINYYGKEFGKENLYIYLDGKNQKIPKNSGNANIIKLPYKEETRRKGDKTRILLLSELARKLFAKGYDIVIGCDCDEFLIVDPKLNTSLRKYLSNRKIKNTLSGLGLDIGQDLNNEKKLNKRKPFLVQRKYALLSSRYTKPVVLNKPLIWGSGFHSVKRYNFHLDKNLYILHFGSVDFDMIKNKIGDRTPSWKKHLKRRIRTINIITKAKNKNFPIKIGRFLQTVFRPVYDLNKPSMLGMKRIVTIPKRFQKTKI